MKRLTTALLGLGIMLTVSAQTVQENEMAIVYYMPENQLVFDV